MKPTLGTALVVTVFAAIAAIGAIGCKSAADDCAAGDVGACERSCEKGTRASCDKGRELRMAACMAGDDAGCFAVCVGVSEAIPVCEAAKLELAIRCDHDDLSACKFACENEKAGPMPRHPSCERVEHPRSRASGSSRSSHSKP